MKPNSINRRTFITSIASAVSAAAIVPRRVLGGPGYIAPSDKINVGVIGVGTQALRMIWEYLRNDQIQITAVCDCNRDTQDYPEWARFDLRDTIRRELDEPRWGEKDKGCRCGSKTGQFVVETFYRKKFNKAKWQGLGVYEDFRDLLHTEKNLDAVWIMTPDHSHGVIAFMAMKIGKHIIMHKPLSNVLAESRLVAKAAEEYKVATHMYCDADNQMRPLIKEWLQAGAIGPVREVHNWSCRPVWPQGMNTRPKKKRSVPSGFNWDLWLGPAAERPYHPDYTHTNFRGWYDFGAGPLGDMGHYSGMQIWHILDLGLPISVEANASHVYIINATGQAEKLINDVSFPHATTVHWQFPQRGSWPALDFYWYDGGIKPPTLPELEEDGRKMPEEGLLFVGDHGKILADFQAGSPRLIPEKAMSAFVRPPQTLPRPEAELDQWIRACRGGAPSDACFQVVQPITETLLLGNIAIRMKEKLHWHADLMKFENNEQADRLVTRENRKGWELI